MILKQVYENLPNPDSSLAYAKKALAIAEELGHDGWMSRCLMGVGYAYKMKGDTDKSLKYLLLGAEYSAAEGDDVNLAIINSAIGDVYTVATNYTLAKEYYKKVLPVFIANSDSVRWGTLLLNLGEVFRLEHSLDSSLVYFYRSRDIFDKLQLEIGIGYSLGNIGLAYAEQDQYIKAKNNITRATKLLKKLGDYYPITVYDISLADIYQDRKEYEKALIHARNALDIANQQGFKEQIRDACKKLSEIYLAIGNHQKAFDYQTKYYAYKDSVVDQETIRKMADMRTEYEVNQKQSEVDLLVSEKTRQTVVAVSLGVVTVLVMIVAFLLYRNNQQRKQANELLEEQKEEIETQRDQLDELNRTKDRFFSIISHDLRGPVQAFKGMGRLIKVLVEEENIAELKELNVDFDNSVSQLSRVLDDLLDWAMAQQGSIPFHPEKVELPSVVNNLKDLFHNMARAKNISLATDVESDLAVFADMNSLNTILRNLLNNALKFTSEGGHIQLSAIRKKGMVAISVRDTGIGISKDKLDSLFKLGGSKRSWGTQGEKGLGLGLQLVYQFTALNGGEVTVESEENEGSVFTVYLPAHQ
ncbi:tetratricopeptide repeat-containing sensor histidine kinase [Fulvivirga maritima]|uniref:sensor histidine kinase n=1 Tax=Fulvivirga maritima TaxID=2904247 RepID=UPI001F31D5C5|nr:tetratricopeptide repeat-containing sensor histidine kinase [Fulvivirga maritima]UII24524.1 tetratricopeptide repeat-containing sensor histidine kinase [Fulvivirga maritima]